MFVPFPATSPTGTSGPVLAPEPPLPAHPLHFEMPCTEGRDHSHPLNVLRASEEPVPCCECLSHTLGHSQSPPKPTLEVPSSASALETVSSSRPWAGHGSGMAAPSLKKELGVPFSFLPSFLPIWVSTAFYTESKLCSHGDRAVHHHRQQTASAPRWCWPRARPCSKRSGLLTHLMPKITC